LIEMMCFNFTFECPDSQKIGLCASKLTIKKTMPILIMNY